MTLNPFIELARDPVNALSVMGYLVLIAVILLVGPPHALRLFIEEVYNDWRQNAHRDKWKRLRGEGRGWIPPKGVSLRILWCGFVIWASFQAASALLELGGVDSLGGV